MRAVIQRVTGASLTVEGAPHCAIGKGLMVLVAIEDSDTQEDAQWLAQKVARLRIFDDQNGVMNLDLSQSDGEVMVVSQFTLFASTRKGNRPSYIRSSKEAVARPLYLAFVDLVEQELGRGVATGVFGADMKIDLCNDGPVTIIIDTKLKE